MSDLSNVQSHSYSSPKGLFFLLFCGVFGLRGPIELLQSWEILGEYYGDD